MITQKYNKQFTDSELAAYIQNIQAITGNQTATVDEAWRTLGYINASAFKGYGELSDDHAAYNGKVYQTKEQAIVILAQHTDNFTSWNGVFYIRLLNGIQVSFHDGSSFWHRNEQLSNLYSRTRKETEWDGVANSYTYTDIKAYNEARTEYQRKRQEDAEKKKRNNAILHDAIQAYFKHHMTRKSFGLPTKKGEWETKVKEAMNDKGTDIEFVLRSYGVNQWNGSWNQIAFVKYDIIRKNLPANWREMNTYNFND